MILFRTFLGFLLAMTTSLPLWGQEVRIFS